MSTRTDDRVGSDNLTSFPCRRRRVRQDLISLLYVDIGTDNGGIVLNLSEEGFCVQAALPLVAESFSNIRFKSCSYGGFIEVGGRLVWMSNTRAGIQFVDLSEDARKQIRAWMALEASPQRHNQPARNDGPQATCGAPSAREPGRRPGLGPQPGIDQLLSPRAGDPKEDRLPGKLPHLVTAEASASENGPPQRSVQRMGRGDDAPVSSDLSRDTVNAVEAIPRSQFLGSQAGSGWQRDLPRSPHARARLPYSKGIVFTVFLSAALTFAAGLVLGHVLWDRPSNGAATVAASEPPAARNAAPTTTVDNPAVALSEANTPPLNAPANALASIATPRVSGPTAPLANSASDNDLQRSAAGPRSRRGEPVMPPHSESAVSPVAQRNLPVPAKPYSEHSGQSAEQSVNTPGSPQSESLGPIQTQTVKISGQPLHPDGAPPSQPAHSESALSTASVSGVLRPANMSVIASGASGTSTTGGRPEESRVLAVAPLRDIDPCRLVHAVQPVYPREAKQQHLEGDVELRLVVGTDGKVRSIKMVSGLPLLASAAMDAARGFRYSPALFNGQPIETIQTVDISFKLKH